MPDRLARMYRLKTGMNEEYILEKLYDLCYRTKKMLLKPLLYKLMDWPGRKGMRNSIL